MGDEKNWVRRRDELLAQLAARAVSCPGLYPFRGPEEFLRVAQDHSGGEGSGLCNFGENVATAGRGAPAECPEPDPTGERVGEPGSGWRGTGQKKKRVRSGFLR